MFIRLLNKLTKPSRTGQQKKKKGKKPLEELPEERQHKFLYVIFIPKVHRRVGGQGAEELELKGKTNNWMCLSVISSDEEIGEILEGPRAGSIRGS